MPLNEHFNQQDELQSSVMFAVLSEMADGIALFDEQHRLVFCNDQYHNFFSLTRDVRVPGASLPDILAAAANCGEQLGIPSDIPRWIENVLDSMRHGGEEEVRLWDGRIIHVRTRAVQNLGAVSVVSDITKMRQTEIQLSAATKQLEIQASIDPLTQLYNRRVLDERLALELARTQRSGDVFSMILLDIDFFKKFNDFYGHVEGDKCLKLVSKILTDSLVRTTDMVARFGGEEFCILLPFTDEEGASLVAERMRQSIASANISHKKSRFGHLSVSCGVAAVGADWNCQAPADLIRRADSALYAAKAGGRNRVYRFTALSDAA